MRILVADPIHPEGVDRLRRLGHTVDVCTGTPLDEIALTEGLVVRSATRVTRDLIAAAPALKVIGRAGAGVDTIDLKAASERGIAVLNVPGGNSISAAEHTLALLLALVRRVVPADASLRAGRWQRSHFEGTELHGKTLGLIGYGRVGREVATRALAFGMQVIATDPVAPPDPPVERVPLPHLLERADVVSLHTALTPETRGVIDAAALTRMKRGALLLNVARGGLVRLDAVLAALQSGQLGGAGLDVFDPEPPQLGQLAELEQVVLTPHLGASTAEAQWRCAVEIAEDIDRFARGEAPVGKVEVA